MSLNAKQYKALVDLFTIMESLRVRTDDSPFDEPYYIEREITPVLDKLYEDSEIFAEWVDKR